MKNMLLILVIVSCFNIFASEIKQSTDFSCSMPILLKPIIKHVRNSNKIIKNDSDAPKRCLEQKFAFVISSFSPSAADQSQYDKFVQIDYSDLKYKFKLYIKNDIVMKIEQIDSNDNVITYKQTVINEMNALRFKDLSYLKLSKEILMKAYAAEPVILKLHEGNHSTQIALTVAGDVDVGELRLANNNFEYRFCYYKGHMENAALLVNDSQYKKLIFSMTLNKNNLTLANIYDRDALNGFDCGFYPNHGLKFYSPMENGIFENVTIWSLNGIKHRIYPFDVWQKKGRRLLYNE